MDEMHIMYMYVKLAVPHYIGTHIYMPDKGMLNYRGIYILCRCSRTQTLFIHLAVGDKEGLGTRTLCRYGGPDYCVEYSIYRHIYTPWDGTSDIFVYGVRVASYTLY